MKSDITYYRLGFLRRLLWRVKVSWAGLQKSMPTENACDIVVTTYIARFDTYFKGIIFQLHSMFPDRKIFVVVNGYHDTAKQATYLNALQSQVVRYQNVTLICCDAPIGLSAMWNAGISKTGQERVLVLNDDIYLMANFREQFESSGILNNPVAVINGSWSHFLISKSLLTRIGLFDEGFRQFGYEDLDYMIRLAAAKVDLPSFSMSSIVNCVEQPTEYSYAREIEVSDGKYSSINERYLHNKWSISDLQHADSVWVPFMKKWVGPKLTQQKFS